MSALAVDVGYLKRMRSGVEPACLGLSRATRKNSACSTGRLVTNEIVHIPLMRHPQVNLNRAVRDLHPSIRKVTLPLNRDIDMDAIVTKIRTSGSLNDILEGAGAKDGK